MQERRVESRMICADMVDVCWTDTSGRQRRLSALLEDISPHGACLQFEKAVPLGADLTIEHKQGRMAGTVRYCLYRDIGYFVGVQFAPESGWSPEKFQPQHLLDLEELVLRSAKKAARR
jgi:PilZ domain-containing protein